HPSRRHLPQNPPEPARIQREHLVTPVSAGGRIAGVHLLIGNTDQGARQQSAADAETGEAAAPAVHHPDGPGAMAVGAVAGATATGPAALHERQRQVMPELSGGHRGSVVGSEPQFTNISRNGPY